jgi:hypothetical protein
MTNRKVTLLTMLPLAAVFVAAHPGAVSAEPSCTTALNALISDWNSIGFAEPQKPSQMIVSGRHGYTTTAGHFYFMRQQIRDAARDCQAGHDELARRQIELARGGLGHTTHQVQYGD